MKSVFLTFALFAGAALGGALAAYVALDYSSALRPRSCPSPGQPRCAPLTFPGGVGPR
jgi:hypothetical protein